MYTSNGSRIKTAQRPAIPKKTQPAPPTPHLFEKYLSHPLTRRILLHLTTGPNGRTPLEKIFYSYRNPNARWTEKVKYAPVHRAIDYFVAKAASTPDRAKLKVLHHQPTVRTLVNTARSVAVHGLLAPQRFISPLLVVWNITNACNLSCRHCYQDAARRRGSEELNRAEKIAVIDQLSENLVPLVAIAGGEPLVDPDLWSVLGRAQKKQVYATLATNGTLLTSKNCERLASLGVKYVEVSLDSVDPSIHDDFRQMKGAWARSVEGIKNVKAAGMRSGIACCFTKDTVEHAQEMLDFASSLGVSTFVHFNFIPVGRGVEMAHEDMSPAQREQLLRLLQQTLDTGKIGVMSTAPQFGRSCLMFGDPDGMMAMGHGGSGKGRQARVVSKYIGGCGAHRCYCCIQPNGHVNPCVYMPTRTLGDLRKNTLAEIWNQPLEAILSDREDRGDHCGVCDYRAFCGGCRARAESYTGDVQAGDPGCIYNQHMWDEIMARRGRDLSVLHEPTAKKVGVGGRGGVTPPVAPSNGNGGEGEPPQPGSRGPIDLSSQPSA
jgi:radical SAM protein with 4Fe4S-binding SPASM domain